MTHLCVLALMLIAMQAPSPIVTAEFIYETAPFPSAHASTIVETRDGLVAAWFGGTRERAPDVGIWVSRRANGAWTPPVEVANGIQPDGTRLPLWNPVLFDTGDGALTLFYKEGPSPSRWWGMAMTSRDNGRTWTDRRRLPDGVLGPIKNKPVRLADGTIISGSSTESTARPSVWRVHFERSEDGGKTWTVIRPPAPANGSEPDAIQPAILVHADGRLQAVGRTRAERIFETWSSDRGRTWTPLALTSLPNPNSGLDAVTLRDGRQLIVYNHTSEGRTPLDVAVSRDGRTWSAPIALENDPGEYSYPAVIQTGDGLVHITYTWKRQRIKHVVIDPARMQGSPSQPSARFTDKPIVITQAECNAATIGDAVPKSAIGEPVSGVTLSEPRWVAAADPLPARCEVDGRIAPVDTAPTARPINFRAWLPAEWNRRAGQQGGGGMNGVIPDLRGAAYPIDGRSAAQLGFVTYGSDSGHQLRESPEWTLNDENVRNLGYAQLKKTHDAVMAIVQRVYGERPRFSYFTGTSQGGREALTVAQRYPNDYDGVVANVPIVSFSSLMLGPELIRIHEKPAANWVTRAKVNAIRAEFMRQCDGLDGAFDAVIANYMACRAIFDLSEGAPNRHPWAAKRCPDNVDPDPADTSAKACLTDGQISTLELVYSRYPFATALANGARTFGMWVPNTDPSGSGLIVDTRFKGQEGAAPDAPAHSHLGVLGVTGFLMRDVSANPLDYTEGGPLNARRQDLSAILDSTNPDLREFARRGGRMIVTIGTNDTLASPGAQLDYFQSVIDTMGRHAVDEFARLFVIPQANHGLIAAAADVDGNGGAVPRVPLPTSYERFAVLVDWVERKVTPPMSLTMTGEGGRSAPLCSYPSYPKGTACTNDQPAPKLVR